MRKTRPIFVCAPHETLGRGNREHFFHFFLGYLVPSLVQVIQAKKALQQTSCSVVFQSCGPVMDKVTLEAAAACGLQVDIAPDLPGLEIKSDQVFIAERLDLMLVRPFVYRGEAPPFIQRRWQQYEASTGYMVGADEEAYRSALGQKLRQIRSVILSALGGSEMASERKAVTLIKRSEVPDYYRAGRGAKNEGYGVSRRALLGVSSYKTRLRTDGIDAHVFEPGSASLMRQIAVFRESNCVVAMRGAELAHMLWMKPGSMVVQVAPEEMPSPPRQRVLAETLSLKFHEIKVAEAQLDIGRVKGLRAAIEKADLSS